MKKLIAIIILTGILLSLCACGNKRGGSKIETEPTEETVLSTEEQSVATEAQSETETETEAETKAETTTEAKQKISPEECKAAYKAFLKKYVKENDIEDQGENTRKFALIFLDDDNIPELVIPQGDFHGAQCELYCFDGQSVRFLGEYGSWGRFSYRPESGYFYGGMGNQGSSTVSYYKFENGAVTELGTFTEEPKSMYSDWDDPDSFDYYIGDEQVSFDEYTEKEGSIREKIDVDKAIDTASQENHFLNEASINAI